MRGFVERNKALLFILAAWFVVGTTAAPVFYALGTLTIALFWRRKMYFELLVGFFFILILSDNLKHTTDFAKNFKNIYIVALAVVGFFERRDLQPVNHMFLYFLPFVVVSIPGLIDSPNMVTGLQKSLSYVLLFFAVPQFFIAAFRQMGPRVVKDLLYLALFMVLVGFALRYIDPGVAVSHGGRFRGVFGNPNGLGIFCTLLVVLTMTAREYFGSYITKNDLRWLLIPALVAVVLTGSRTSIIATLLFLGFIRFFRFSPVIGFATLLAIAVATEAISANLVEIVQYLGLEAFFRVETLQAGSGRYIAWQFAWEHIQDAYWLGRGFAFDEWLMYEHQDFLNELGHQGGVHNTYLILWLNAGLVGLLLFLRALVLLFIQASKHTVLAIPTLWVVLFTILLEPWLAASLNPFTIVLICILSIMTDPAFQPFIRGEMNGSNTAQPLPAHA